MSALGTALRWDATLQARNGFYQATVFIVLVMGALLLAIPEALRADRALWVPAVLAVNLQITTFFFVAGLMLLEREEGTLAALGVSPLGAGTYLLSKTVTLTALAALETVLLIWIAFGTAGDWVLILLGTAAIGAVYTGLGVAVGARFRSVNALLLPASLVVTLLLLPLLPHFGLAPRAPSLLHPLEPPLALIRAGYGAGGAEEIAYGVAGSAIWAAVAFLLGRRAVRRLMESTEATGGR
jgi:fluoroquinolone transport system permease protein